MSSFINILMGKIVSISDVSLFEQSFRYVTPSVIEVLLYVNYAKCNIHTILAWVKKA